jgi:hypothetical protein
MTPMLKLFGVEQGNGLCELAVGNYETPKDSCNFVAEFFKPLKRTSRMFLLLMTWMVAMRKSFMQIIIVSHLFLSMRR